MLCQFPNSSVSELYAFGSNHFGQLGLGKNITVGDANLQNQGTFYQTNEANVGPVKYSLPQRIIINSLNNSIRLIHTKFFTNVSKQTFTSIYFIFM